MDRPGYLGNLDDFWFGDLKTDRRADRRAYKQTYKAAKRNCKGTIDPSLRGRAKRHAIKACARGITGPRPRRRRREARKARKASKQRDRDSRRMVSKAQRRAGTPHQAKPDPRRMVSKAKRRAALRAKRPPGPPSSQPTPRGWHAATMRRASLAERALLRSGRAFPRRRARR